MLFQTAAADAAQADIWSERRRAVRAGTPMQLASLATVPGARVSAIVSQMPRIDTQLADVARSRPSRRREADALSLLVSAAPLKFVSVVEVDDAGGGSATPPIIILQDVHLHAEAQRNAAGAIIAFSDAGLVGRVGVEGAFGPFDFSRFRAFRPENAMARATDRFLEHNRLSAPAWAGIRMRQSGISFLGVDDSAAYADNLAAWRAASKESSRVRSRLSSMSADLKKAKASGLSSRVAAWDATRERHREGLTGFGAYVELLSSSAASPPPMVRRFREAYRLEREMDFARVEAERKRVISMLVPRLSPAELDRLTADSLAYRDGRLGYGAFYGNLHALCGRKGIDFSATPMFERYVRYVVLSDGLRAHDLLRDVRALERAAFDGLSPSVEERRLIESGDALHLAAKLAAFSLTPDEWNGWRALSSAQRENLPDLSAFEAFYRAADRRSTLMLERLASPPGGKAQILVTGGFHSAEITSELRRRRIPHVVLSPRLTKVDIDAAGYLGHFALSKTPLDLMFEGAQLFLSPADVAGVGTADPAARGNTNRLVVNALADAAIEANAEVAFGTLRARPTGGRFARVEGGGVSVDVDPLTGEERAARGVFTRLGDLARAALSAARRLGPALLVVVVPLLELPLFTELMKSTLRTVMEGGLPYPSYLAIAAAVAVVVLVHAIVRGEWDARSLVSRAIGAVVVLSPLTLLGGEAGLVLHWVLHVLWNQGAVVFGWAPLSLVRIDPSEGLPGEVGRALDSGRGLVFTDSPDAMDMQLAAEARRRGVPYLRIRVRNADEWDRIATTIRLEGGRATPEEGEHLGRVVREGGILFIDYSGADAALIEGFNSLFDSPAYYGSTRAHRNLRVVGAADREGTIRQQQAPFFSRFRLMTTHRYGGTRLAPLEAGIETGPAPADAIRAEVDRTPFLWERIVGDFGKDAARGYHFVEILERAIREGRPLVIRTAYPDSSEMQDFLRQLIVNRQIVHNGRAIVIPDGFRVFVEVPDLAALVRPGKSIVSSRPVAPGDAWVLNSETLDRFVFDEAVITDGGEIEQRPGLLSRPELRIRITETMPDWVWDMLLQAPGRFWIEVEPGVRIPPEYASLANDVGDPVQPWTDAPWDAVKNEKSVLLETDDPGLAALDIRREFGDDNVLVVPVTPRTTLADLLYRVSMDMRGGRTHYSVEETDILAALRAGRVVVLQGAETNPELLRQLETALCETPYVNLMQARADGTRLSLVDLPGRLIVVAGRKSPVLARHRAKLSHTSEDVDRALKEEYPDQATDEVLAKWRELESILKKAVPAPARAGLYPSELRFSHAMLRFFFATADPLEAIELMVVSRYAGAPEVAAMIRVLSRRVLVRDPPGLAPNAIRGKGLDRVLASLHPTASEREFAWRLAEQMGGDILRELVPLDGARAPTVNFNVLCAVAADALAPGQRGARHEYLLSRLRGLAGGLRSPVSGSLGTPPFIDDSAPDDIESPEDRQLRIARILDRWPAIALQGAPGTGKSHTARQANRDLGLDAQMGPVTTGADAEEGDVMVRAESDNGLYERRPQAGGRWAAAEGSALLVVDEANLPKNGRFWNFLYGLFSPRARGRAAPTVWADGRAGRNMGAKKVIFTFNDYTMAGRRRQALLDDAVPTVIFPPFEPGFLMAQIDRWLDRRQRSNRDALVKMIFDLHTGFARGDRGYDFSLRDVQEICQRVNALAVGEWTPGQVVSIAWEQYQGVFDPVRREALAQWLALRFGVNVSEIDRKFESEAKPLLPDSGVTMVPSSARYVHAIDTFLDMHQARTENRVSELGKPGMLVEGPSGRGKDRFLTETLRRRGFTDLKSIRLLVAALRRDGDFDRDEVLRIIKDLESRSHAGKPLLPPSTAASLTAAIADGAAPSVIAGLVDVVQALPHYRHLNAKLAYDEMMREIDIARREGSIVIVSELNLLPSAIIEGRLNDALTGDAAKGFAFFATVNSESFNGREVLSSALLNRVQFERLEDYTEKEFEAIAAARVGAAAAKPAMAEALRRLVQAHVWIRSQISSARYHPTTRDLLRAADALARAEEAPDAAVERVLLEVYGPLFLDVVLAGRDLPDTRGVAEELTRAETDKKVNHNLAVLVALARVLLPSGAKDIGVRQKDMKDAGAYYDQLNHMIVIALSSFSNNTWRKSFLHELSHALFSRDRPDNQNATNKDMWDDLEDLRHTAAFDRLLPHANIRTTIGSQGLVNAIQRLDVQEIMRVLDSEPGLNARKAFQGLLIAVGRGQIPDQRVRDLAVVLKPAMMERFGVNPMEAVVEHADAVRRIATSIPESLDEQEVRYRQFVANQLMGPILDAYEALPDTIIVPKTKAPDISTNAGRDALAEDIDLRGGAEEDVPAEVPPADIAAPLTEAQILRMQGAAAAIAPPQGRSFMGFLRQLLTGRRLAVLIGTVVTAIVLGLLVSLGGIDMPGPVFSPTPPIAGGGVTGADGWQMGAPLLFVPSPVNALAIILSMISGALALFFLLRKTGRAIDSAEVAAQQSRFSSRISWVIFSLMGVMFILSFGVLISAGVPALDGTDMGMILLSMLLPFLGVGAVALLWRFRGGGSKGWLHRVGIFMSVAFLVIGGLFTIFGTGLRRTAAELVERLPDLGPGGWAAAIVAGLALLALVAVAGVMYGLNKGMGIHDGEKISDKLTTDESEAEELDIGTPGPPSPFLTADDMSRYQPAPSLRLALDRRRDEILEVFPEFYDDVARTARVEGPQGQIIITRHARNDFARGYRSAKPVRERVRRRIVIHATPVMSNEPFDPEAYAWHSATLMVELLRSAGFEVVVSRRELTPEELLSMPGAQNTAFISFAELQKRSDAVMRAAMLEAALPSEAVATALYDQPRVEALRQIYSAMDRLRAQGFQPSYLPGPDGRGTLEIAPGANPEAVVDIAELGLDGNPEINEVIIRAKARSLPALARLPNLRHLSLPETPYADLAFLPEMPGLTSLQISCPDLPARPTHLFLPNLTGLSISGSRVKSFAFLAEMPGLETLLIDATTVTAPEGYDTIPALPNLRTLDIHDFRSRTLDFVRRMKGLTRVNFTANPDLEDISALAELDGTIESVTLMDLPALRDLGPLSHVFLVHASVSLTAAKDFNEKAVHNRANEIDLAVSRIQAAAEMRGGSWRAAPSRSDHVKLLRAILALEAKGFSARWMGNDEATLVITRAENDAAPFDATLLEGLRSVRSLVIVGPVVNAAAVGSMPNLVDLSFAVGGGLTAEDLRAMTNIRTLTLSGVRVDGAMQDALSGLPLRQLDLINVTGVSSLEFIGRMPSLRRLGMEGLSDVTDAQPLARLAGLEALSMSSMPGIRQIGFLSTLPIGTLNLSHIGAPEAEVRALRAAVDARRVGRRPRPDENTGMWGEERSRIHEAELAEFVAYARGLGWEVDEDVLYDGIGLTIRPPRLGPTPGVLDLGQLKPNPSLRRIHVEHGFENASALSEQPNLQRVELVGVTDDDLMLLSFNHPVELWLRRGRLAEGELILHGVSRLILQDMVIADPRAFVRMDAVEELVLMNVRPPDIWPPHLRRLHVLDAEDDDKRVWSLRNAPNLTELVVVNAPQLERIEGLDALEHLQVIHMFEVTDAMFKAAWNVAVRYRREKDLMVDHKASKYEERPALPVSPETYPDTPDGVARFAERNGLIYDPMVGELVIPRNAQPIDLRPIRGNAHVHRMIIQRGLVDPGVLRSFVALRQVRTSVDMLAVLAHHPSLEELAVFGFDLTRDHEWTLAQGFRHLRRLVLHRSQVKWRGLLDHMPSLESLSISFDGTQIKKGETTVLFPDPKSVPRLKELSLAGMMYTGADFPPLPPSLEVLTITQAPELVTLESLSPLPGLRKLVIDGAVKLTDIPTRLTDGLYMATVVGTGVPTARLWELTSAAAVRRSQLDRPTEADLLVKEVERLRGEGYAVSWNASNGMLAISPDGAPADRPVDLSFLAGSTQLQILHVGAPCRGIEALAGCSSLWSIELTGVSVADLAPLATLPDLRNVRLKSPDLTSGTAHPVLANVGELSIESEGVLDVTHLADVFPSLSTLNLDAGGVVGDLSAQVARLPALHTMTSRGPLLSSLEALAGHPALKQLVLVDNPLIVDVSPLARVPSLRELRLAELPALSSVEPLRGVGLAMLIIDAVPMVTIEDIRTLALAAGSEGQRRYTFNGKPLHFPPSTVALAAFWDEAAWVAEPDIAPLDMLTAVPPMALIRLARELVNRRPDLTARVLHLLVAQLGLPASLIQFGLFSGEASRGNRFIDLEYKEPTVLSLPDYVSANLPTIPHHIHPLAAAALAGFFTALAALVMFGVGFSPDAAWGWAAAVPAIFMGALAAASGAAAVAGRFVSPGRDERLSRTLAEAQPNPGVWFISEQGGRLQVNPFVRRALSILPVWAQDAFLFGSGVVAHERLHQLGYGEVAAYAIGQVGPAVLGAAAAAALSLVAPGIVAVLFGLFVAALGAALAGKVVEHAVLAREGRADGQVEAQAAEGMAELLSSVSRGDATEAAAERLIEGALSGRDTSLNVEQVVGTAGRTPFARAAAEDRFDRQAYLAALGRALMRLGVRITDARLARRLIDRFTLAGVAPETVDAGWMARPLNRRLVLAVRDASDVERAVRVAMLSVEGQDVRIVGPDALRKRVEDGLRRARQAAGRPTAGRVTFMGGAEGLWADGGALSLARLEGLLNLRANASLAGATLVVPDGMVVTPDLPDDMMRRIVVGFLNDILSVRMLAGPALSVMAATARLVAQQA